MDIEEFKNKKSFIEQAISVLKRDLRKLELEYVMSNKQFEIGQKVRVTTPSKPSVFNKNVVIAETVVCGFVGGCSLNWDGSLKTDIVQMKKDGKPSTRRLYYSNDSIIEIV